MKLSVVYSLKTAGYGAWFLVVSRGVRPAITYTQREATPRTTVTDGGRYAALTPCDAGQTGEAERLCFAAVFSRCIRAASYMKKGASISLWQKN